MKNIIFAVSLLSLIFLVVNPAFAQDSSPTVSPVARGRAVDARIRSCEAREEAVKTRMESLVRLANTMIVKFDSIAERVKNFYTDTVLPSGKSVPNYTALVADIEAKKAIVQTDLAMAQTAVEGFDCEADEPRMFLTEFRTSMQKVKTDLHNFRTSIKNLIVAVRGLAPTPAATPTI